MKCPNCGNEAINVNGKFVCLDCGIEISGGNEASEALPGVGNHVEPEPVVAAPAQEEPKPSFFTNSREKVIVPPPKTAQGPSLKEQYLAELEREEKTQNAGVFDFSAAPSPTPDFPVGTDASTQSAGTPAPEPTVAPEPPVAPPSEPVQPQTNDLPQSLDFNVLSSLSTPAADPVQASVQPVAAEPESPAGVAALQVVPAAAEPVAIPSFESPQPEAPVAPETPVIPEEIPTENVAVPVQEEITVEATSEIASEPVEPSVTAPAENPFDVNITPANNLGDPVPADVPEAPKKEPATTTPEPEVFNPVPEEEEIEIPINRPQTTPEPEATALPPETPQEPENYFQPSSINITPAANQEQPAPVPETVLPTPLDVSVEAAQEPVTEAPLEPAQPTEPQVSPTPEVPETANMPAPDLDALLDNYAGTGVGTPAAPTGSIDSVRPASVESSEGTQGSSTIPGANSIPSVASVFEDGYVDPNPAIEQKAKKNKKMLIIIGAVVGILLIFGAIGAFFLASMSASNSEEAKIKEFEKAVMEGVPAKIEEPQNIRVSYRDALDFSKLSLKPQVEAATGQELLKLFATPLISEGNWDTNTEKHISQNSRVAGQSLIRVYMDDEKMTYVSDGGNWKKVEGRQIVGVPAFFNPVERGSLFYSSKVEKLVYQKKISGTEKTLYEFRVYPKEDLLKEHILGASPLFSKAKIESIDTSNLEILVQVDEEKNLHNVNIKGEATVAADIFSGKITFDSFATYLYTQTEIIKPSVAFWNKKEQG